MEKITSEERVKILEFELDREMTKIKMLRCELNQTKLEFKSYRESFGRTMMLALDNLQALPPEVRKFWVSNKP
jgi:hypothetical protein